MGFVICGLGPDVAHAQRICSMIGFVRIVDYMYDNLHGSGVKILFLSQ
jgi:hypothetical protein